MGSNTTERGFQVRALGEVAIRCADMVAMERFYTDIIGLEKLASRSVGITFFRIGEGYAGHTTVLALFDRNAGSRLPDGAPPEEPHTGPRSSLHHLALTVGWDEQERVMRWYDRLGQPYHVEQFDWIGWRGVFTEDPEGNTVELVAASPAGPVTR